jgi:MFS transporter, DHA1 family, multidrug resistance protein
MAIIVLGMGIVFPNASAAAVSVHPEIAGTASALMGFLQMAGGGIGVVVVAAVTAGSHLPLTWAMLAFSIAAALSPVIGKLARSPRGHSSSN